MKGRRVWEIGGFVSGAGYCIYRGQVQMTHEKGPEKFQNSMPRPELKGFALCYSCPGTARRTLSKLTLLPDYVAPPFCRMMST